MTLVLAAISLLAIGCDIGEDRTADEIRDSVERSLQPGSTLAELRDYINTSGKDLGMVDTIPDVAMASDIPVELVDKHGLTSNTPIHTATINRPTRTFTVVFILNEELLFERVLVLEYLTLP